MSSTKEKVPKNPSLDERGIEPRTSPRCGASLGMKMLRENYTTKPSALWLLEGIALFFFICCGICDWLHNSQVPLENPCPPQAQSGDEGLLGGTMGTLLREENSLRSYMQRFASALNPHVAIDETADGLQKRSFVSKCLEKDSRRTRQIKDLSSHCFVIDPPRHLRHWRTLAKRLLSQ